MDSSVAHTLKYFTYEHLPENLQKVSMPFCQLATELACLSPNNPETAVALRKLLEAKDAAVRASLPHDQATVNCDGRVRLEVDEVVVRSRDGKHVLQIASSHDGVGLWVTHGSDSVCIYSGSNVGPGPYVGVISPKNNGCPFAVSIHDGKACLQVSTHNQIRNFSVEEVAALISKE